MSTTTIVLIAVPVLVVLAALLLFASSRRKDADAAIGQLSAETAKRDRGPVAPEAEPGAPPVTGREIERAAALERRGGGLAVQEAAPVDVRSLGRAVVLMPLCLVSGGLFLAPAASRALGEW